MPKLSEDLFGLIDFMRKKMKRLKKEKKKNTREKENHGPFLFSYISLQVL